MLHTLHNPTSIVNSAIIFSQLLKKFHTLELTINPLFIGSLTIKKNLKSLKMKYAHMFFNRNQINSLS
jgi:hypothetical protein